jgi:shikimate dehydrogenase
MGRSIEHFARQATKKKRYGLVGRNISYSLSPAIHEFSAAFLGLEVSYELIDIEPAELEPFLTRALNWGFEGLNITTPYKQTVAAIVNSGSQESINTLKKLDGDTWQSFSTDEIGFGRTLAEDLAPCLPNAHWIIWGSGGAASALAIFILSESTFSEHTTSLTVVCRESGNLPWLKKLQLEFQGKLIQQISWSDGLRPSSTCGYIPKDLPRIIISAVPADVFSTVDLNDFYRNYSGGFLDLSYNPSSSNIMSARSNGWLAQDGLNMLIHQALAAQNIWWQQSAPFAAVHSYLEKFTAKLK